MIYPEEVHQTRRHCRLNFCKAKQPWNPWACCAAGSLSLRRPLRACLRAQPAARCAERNS